MSCILKHTEIREKQSRDNEQRNPSKDETAASRIIKSKKYKIEKVNL